MSDVLEASFDSPLRDEIIFLWLSVEGVDNEQMITITSSKNSFIKFLYLLT